MSQETSQAEGVIHRAVTMSCDASGLPAPKYEFYKVGALHPFHTLFLWIEYFFSNFRYFQVLRRRRLNDIFFSSLCLCFRLSTYTWIWVDTKIFLTHKKLLNALTVSILQSVTCLCGSSLLKVEEDDTTAKRVSQQLCSGCNYDLTSIRRPFDCLSKVIEVTVT